MKRDDLTELSSPMSEATTEYPVAFVHKPVKVPARRFTSAGMTMLGAVKWDVSIMA